MKPIFYKRHRFPTDAIRQAVWLYFRFTMSFRDVEDLLAERGIDVSYETSRSVGPFRVTLYLMDHSAYDAHALMVEAGGRRLLYTGDFRGHGRKQGVVAPNKKAGLTHPPGRLAYITIAKPNRTGPSTFHWRIRRREPLHRRVEYRAF